MATFDVLVVGAGPTGLMMAVDLLRHGISCCIIDKNERASERSKALVVQVRTLEIFNDLGIAEEAIARSQKIQGAHFTADDRANIRVNIGDTLAVESPFPNPVILEQSKTEELLIECLEKLGGSVERKTELIDFIEKDGIISATLKTTKEEKVITCRWLVGCDGAHSTVRHKLGLSFAGSRYEDEFVLADVDLDWDEATNVLRGFVSRRGLFAALPMYGSNHYRLIMVRRGFHGQKGVDPTLKEIQEIADNLTKIKTKISNPRWISYFVIHCRGVNLYSKGNVFVAGDAAHIHSPAGGQGMNTGIQDAYNLAWKIALVKMGVHHEKILQTYHEERYPVGRFILKNTDKAFRAMIKSSLLIRIVRGFFAPVIVRLKFVQYRIAKIVSQTGIHYKSSSIVENKVKKLFVKCPQAGERAPDAIFLQNTKEITLFTLIRGTKYTLLLCKISENEDFEEVIKFIEENKIKPYLNIYQVSSSEENKNNTLVDRTFFKRYSITKNSLYLIRPDGHIAFSSYLKKKDFFAYLAKISLS